MNPCYRKTWLWISRANRNHIHASGGPLFIIHYRTRLSSAGCKGKKHVKLKTKCSWRSVNAVHRSTPKNGSVKKQFFLSKETGLSATYVAMPRLGLWTQWRGQIIKEWNSWKYQYYVSSEQWIEFAWSWVVNFIIHSRVNLLDNEILGSCYVRHFYNYSRIGLIQYKKIRHACVCCCKSSLGENHCHARRMACHSI